MRWITWRHYRLELVICAATLFVLAMIFIPAGFLGFYWPINWLVGLVNFLPCIVGPLLAIPIVLEFEQRTYRLAWTQSVSRRRWFAVKLAFALIVALIFSTLLTVLMSWYLNNVDKQTSPFEHFYIQGIAPVAYTVFTLTLALAVGTWGRQTAFAVLTALVVFVVIALGIGNELRPHYMTPIRQTVTVSSGIPSLSSIPDNAWILDQYPVDASGNRISGTGLLSDNASGTIGGTQYVVVEYQPASRYWPFQGIESALFLGLSGLALGVTFWAVKQKFR